MASATPKPAVKPLDRHFHGSTGINNYDLEQKLGEGTFGEVYRAKSKKSGEVFALKKILMHNEKDGFPITALREIKLLKMLSHVNVIRLQEMAIERADPGSRKRATLYMVTPYMDHDLSGLLDNRDVHLTVPHIKCYMLQLLRGLKYLHNSHILHRDMKAANLLINNRGILKIADFGLARHYDEEVPKAGQGGGEAKRDYTTLVVTRWYRPPELLLQLRRYTTAIDMWGAGCVFGEMFTRKPILMGKSDLNQAEIIFELVGSPNDRNMPGWNALPGCEGVKAWDPQPGNLEQVFGRHGSDTVSLMRQLLKLDWRKRINAIDALEHPYFKNHPLPARPEDIPWFDSSHELDRRNGRDGRGPGQALPPAPAGGAVGGGANESWASNGPPNGSYDHSGRNSRYPPGSGPPPTGRGFDNRIPHHDNRVPHHDNRVPHDSRVPNAAYDGRGAPLPRRQPWQQSDAPPVRSSSHLPPPPPEGSRHALPPRPTQGLPPPRDSFGSREPRSRDSSHPPRDSSHPPRDSRDPHPSRDARRKPNLDSYVPSYSGGNRRDERHSVERDDQYRPSRRDEGRRGSRDDDGRRGSKDEGKQLADYYDRDNPAPGGGRDRPREHRRSRSRSPVRDDRERDRARERERDRDIYRR